jgi:hypothetical protein
VSCMRRGLYGLWGIGRKALLHDYWLAYSSRFELTAQMLRSNAVSQSVRSYWFLALLRNPLGVEIPAVTVVATLNVLH